MTKILHHFFGLFTSSIKIFFLRIRGARIGKRVSIGRVKFKTKPQNIFIGDGVVIGNDVIFDKLKSIVIKDYVKIHEGVRVENGTNGNASFSISYNSWVGGGTILNCERNITIESNVGIGCRSQIWTHGYFPSSADGYPSKFGTVTIREGVWLPPSCIILPGVEVGNNSIIGTGSVVTKNVPDKVFATGVPCQVKAKEKAYRKTLTPLEKINSVLDGCTLNIKMKGGTIEKIEENTWRCKFFLKKFIISFQKTPENCKYQENICIFTWDKPKNTNIFTKKTSIFILSNNSYTKKSTLHEWIIIRSLLDSCTLRLKPFKN